jgi:hypothetical protein
MTPSLTETLIALGPAAKERMPGEENIGSSNIVFMEEKSANGAPSTLKIGIK